MPIWLLLFLRSILEMPSTKYYMHEGRLGWLCISGQYHCVEPANLVWCDVMWCRRVLFYVSSIIMHLLIRAERMEEPKGGTRHGEISVKHLKPGNFGCSAPGSLITLVLMLKSKRAIISSQKIAGWITAGKRVSDRFLHAVESDYAC